MARSQRASRDLISVVALIWNDRKPEISAATAAEARSIAESEIHVQGTIS